MYRIGYGNMMGWSQGPSIISIIFNVLFGLLIAFIIIWILKMLFRHGREEKDMDEEGDNKYVQILKERYAKGELTKKEFDERKKDLS